MRRPLPQDCLELCSKKKEQGTIKLRSAGVRWGRSAPVGARSVCGGGNEDGTGTTLKRSCMCIRAKVLVRITVLFFFRNVVMGVNLMQREGKAGSVDRHRRDHSLQCA